jgi:hypothetical protein
MKDKDFFKEVLVIVTSNVITVVLLRILEHIF